MHVDVMCVQRQCLIGGQIHAFANRDRLIELVDYHPKHKDVSVWFERRVVIWPRQRCADQTDGKHRQYRPHKNDSSHFFPFPPGGVFFLARR